MKGFFWSYSETVVVADLVAALVTVVVVDLVAALVTVGVVSSSLAVELVEDDMELKSVPIVKTAS